MKSGGGGIDGDILISEGSSRANSVASSVKTKISAIRMSLL